MGEYQAARELDEDTLARKRRVLGDDHPGTLISAGNLAFDLRRLGEYQAARELDEDTVRNLSRPSEKLPDCCSPGSVEELSTVSPRGRLQ